MSEIGKLFVTIGADIGGMEKGIKDAKGKLESVGKKFEQTGKKIQGAGVGMSKYVTAPIVAAGAGIIGLANKYASMGDHIGKTATKLGVSTDALQEMDYWAGQNGISAGAMERAVGRLNQRIGRAAQGNEKYAEAFEAVNVSLHDTEGNLRSTEEVMYDTIAALRDIEDPALRSAQASEIFGTKMARDLMPALEDGSLSLEDAAKKAQELGIIMDGEAVKAAEAYEDAMDDLKRSFGAVFQEIATKLIPILVDDVLPVIQDQVIPAIREFAERIGNLIEWFMNLDPEWQRLIGIAIGFLAALGPVLIIVGKIITVIGALTPLLGVLKVVFLALTGPIGLVVAAVAGAIAIGVLLWKNWDKIKEKANELFGQVKAKFNDIKEAIKKPISEARQFISDQIEKIKGFFSGLKLTIPKPKMPKFELSGRFSINPPSVPRLSVKWHAAGGVMKEPTIFGGAGNTLFGGGEAGAEGIVPLQGKHMHPIADAIADRLQGLTSAGNNFIAATSSGTLSVRHEIDLRNAPAGLDTNDLKSFLFNRFNDPSYQRELDHTIHKISDNRARPGGTR